MVTPKTIDSEMDSYLQNQIIRASAGTGKTFALSNRYLILLASGVECQSILATTFTRKGAGEILDRIVQRLSNAALSDEAAKTLSAELDFVLTRSRAADVLQNLLKNLHRLEISTLDSFFNRVAKVFSLELGLPPTWDVVEEQQIEMLRDSAVQSVLRNDQIETLLNLMSKGESTRRVATLILDTVRQVYEIYRESDSAAWHKLEEPTQRLTTEQLEALQHEVLGREFESGKQLPKHWDVVKDLIRTEQWDAIAELKSFQNVLAGKEKFGSSNLPEDLVQMIQLMIVHCRWWVTRRLIERNRSTYDLLRQYGDEFEESKDRLGQLRFDDVTDRLKNISQDWTTDRFAFRLDNQIQHLLLDEFQDTSPTQWSIIRPFAQSVTQDGGSGRSFFCVGDMKQAIYGWRGGVAEIFGLVETQLQNLVPTPPLLKSFRSSPVVIDFVNEVFGQLELYTSKDELTDKSVHQWKQWFSQHTTERTSYAGYVAIEYAEDHGQKDDNGKPKVNRFVGERIRDEKHNEAVVARVKQLADDLPDHGSIGVLVRTNKEVGALIFSLQQAGVEASEEGGNPLTDSAAVEMILSALQLCDHPGDDVARFHVASGPLNDLFDLVPEGDLNRPENKKAAAGGAAKVRRLLMEQGYGPTVEMMANRLAPVCTRRELLRLQHLVRLAYGSPDQAEQWALRPGRFVEHVREIKIGDQSSAKVRVMTIHKSKGLEFDAVVLPVKSSERSWSGMPPEVVVGRDDPTQPARIVTRYASKDHQKLLPAEFQQLFTDDKQRTVREAMCVLYVALTRAARSVHVVLSYGIKPESKSLGGVLMSTVAKDKERQSGAVVYEAGDPKWYRDLDELEAENDQQRALNKFYFEAAQSKPANHVVTEVRSGRGLGRVRPSMLEGGDKIELSQIFGRYAEETALQRGQLMHGCFEMVQWSDEGLPTSVELRNHLETISPSSNLIGKVISDFYVAIEKSPLSMLMRMQDFALEHLIQFDGQSNRMEVRNEHRFAIYIGNNGENAELMEGIVDRLVLIYENNTLVAADVIDFKTDTVAPHEIAQKVDFYAPQLEAYRVAVGSQFGLELDRISTRLAFVSTGDVVKLKCVEASVNAASLSPIPKAVEQPQQTHSTKRVVESSVPQEQLDDSHASHIKHIVNQGKADLPKDAAGAPKKRKQKKPSPGQKTLWDE